MIELSHLFWYSFLKKRITLISCLLLIASIFIDCKSQFAFPYGFDESGFEHHKSLNNLTDFVQKTDGTIWTLTAGGEVRKLDGGEVKEFDYIPNEPNSTLGTLARSIFKDRLNNIWISYKWSNVISKVSHDDESFSHLKYPQSLGNILDFGENEDGQILILGSNGIYKLVNDSIFKPIYNSESQIDKGIYIGNGSFLYISNSIFHQWKNSGNSITKSESIKGAFVVTKMVLLEKSTALFQTNYGTLKILDFKNTFKIRDIEHDQFADFVLNDALMLNDSIGFIATKGEGLLIFNLPKATIIDYVHFYNRRNRALELNVNSVFKDQMNVVWIAKESGIMHLNLSHPNFDNNGIRQNEPYSLDNHITDLISLNDNQILIANRKGQIQKVDSELNPINEPIQVCNSGSSIYKIHKENDSTIFLGANGALYQYNPIDITGNSLNMVYSFKSPYSKIKIIEKWNEDTLLLSLGVSSALYCIKTGKVLKANSLEKVEERKEFRYVCAYTDNDNLIWINTSVGTYIFDVKRRLHKVFFESDNGILKDEIIPDLLQVDSFLYLATMHSGLWKVKRNINFDLDTIVLPFERFDEKYGLASNSIFSLACRNNNIWMGTDKGISLKLDSSQSFYNFDKTSGLISDDFSNQAVAFIPSNNSLAFAGNYGIDLVNTQNIEPFFDSVIPKIHKVEKYINGVTSEYFETFDTPKQVNKLWVLAYNNHHLNIELSSNSYFRWQENRYRYKVAGRDKDWKYLSGQPHITLVNLNPGDYSLLVSVQGHNSSWSEAYTLLRIQVPKPFWQELWFTISCGAALFLMVLTVFQMREKRNIATQRKLEKIVDERTYALNENAKLVQEQNEQLLTSKEKLFKINSKNQEIISILSHDFRGPLATLKGFLTLLSSPTMDLSKRQIDEIALKIGSSLGTSLALLDNLLYWSRDETGLIQMNYEKINISEKVLNALDFFKLSAEIKSIDLINSIDQNILIQADGNMLDVFIRNLLSNALKFTPRNGQIEISLKENSGHVYLKVTDSGVGMSADDISMLMYEEIYKSELGTDNEKGTGLGFQLVKRFVQSHNGTIKIHSEKGKGSTFEISLPKSEND